MLIPFTLAAQVKDDFTDGNFSSDPAWSGDTSVFTVNSLHQLQLSSSGTDTSCLVTRGVDLPEMEWNVWVKMSFNTSLNNYSRVYLASDSRVLGEALNGVYIQLGGSGDSIILFKQNGNIHTPLFKFPLLRTNQSVNVFRIRICRDSAGTWDLYADSTGGWRFSKFGSFNDKIKLSPEWLGVFCRYTSSNSARFFFDDFYAGKILRDTIPARVIAFGFSDSLTIRIRFNELVDTTCLEQGSNFSLKNNPEKLLKAYILQSDPETAIIKINTLNNEFYCDTLSIRNISDLSGNLLSDTSIFICYYIPGPCQQGDLVINEVLFDPDAAGSRFIEFYNRSEKVINLNSLSAGTSANSINVVKCENLCSGERMLYPKDFFVITADSAKLISRYYVPDHDNISMMDHFPSMSSDSGFVYLISNEDSAVIDRMWYSKSMHLPFIVNTEGVSLERLDPQGSSDNRANWQSASETSGFASPGYDNSHYTIQDPNNTDIQLSSVIISPDNDGRDDFLYIQMNDEEPGTLLSLRIFDMRGNLVKTLASQSTVSENFLFVWDGTDSNNHIVPMGYYVVLSESLSVSGKKSRVKKAVAVTQKF